MTVYEKLKNFGKKLFKPIRISPHGAFLITSGLIILIDSLKKPQSLLYFVELICACIGLGYGLDFYGKGYEAYKKAKKSITNHGFDKRHLKKYYTSYCERQGLFLASSELEYKKEFNELKDICRKSREYFSIESFYWLPHI
jgi:hypothetical protein